MDGTKHPMMKKYNDQKAYTIDMQAKKTYKNKGKKKKEMPEKYKQY